MPQRKGKGPPSFARTWNSPGNPAYVDRHGRYSYDLTDPPLVSRTPPVFVSFTASTFVGTTTPKTNAPVVQAGDRIVVYAIIENQIGTISVAGGSLTYNLLGTFVGTGWCSIWAWETTATATGTLTITGTAAGVSNSWGMMTYVFRGSDGVGLAVVNNEPDASPPAALLTTQKNRSAVLMGIADWNAAAVTGKTWRTVNSITPTAGNTLEKLATQEVSHMTVYSAMWNDTGNPGVNTYGMTAPTAQTPVHLTVEVFGTGSDAFEGWGLPL